MWYKCLHLLFLLFLAALLRAGEACRYVLADFTAWNIEITIYEKTISLGAGLSRRSSFEARGRPSRACRRKMN